MTGLRSPIRSPTWGGRERGGLFIRHLVTSTSTSRASSWNLHPSNSSHAITKDKGTCIFTYLCTYQVLRSHGWHVVSPQSATLTRVRDNQRRCRARKREYVAGLERKLQECQVAGIRPDAETYQSTVKRLKYENRKLRDLLGQAGVSKTCIEAHLGEDRDTRESSGNSNGTDGQALPYFQESNSPNGLETVS
jgi:hypothetical protein